MCHLSKPLYRLEASGHEDCRQEAGMSVEQFDAIVVGVGGHGSSAVYHLAKRGQKVLGIEQFEIAHDRGSSHGESRIIRLAYHENPDYVPLLVRAYELWQKLQDECGQELLCVTGSVEAASRNIDGKDKSVFRDALLAAQMHGLQHEVLSPAEANARFPGYHLPPDYEVLYQPQGGLLLVPALQACATVQRNVIGWFGITEPGHFNKQRFPVYILQDGHAHFYGFPNYEHPGMKIGKFYHLQQKVLDPSRLDRNITAEDEEELRVAVQDFFPTANGPLLKAAACMFTNTQDTRFVIDFHPAQPQVVLCSACSGHGFKFCSVIGEILADLAMTSTTQHKIEAHRINPDRPGHHEFLQCAKRHTEEQVKNHHAPASHL
ncbi:hypothetical protein WJX73_001474 [Symbiochloris irregularis]|uniref:FAD dependent oxidoreductase domain-containing protein n=1 Tax=Symbiochloris irregularis TaxID=706552 RepID=A0AAW1PL17_9CHLO